MSELYRVAFMHEASVTSQQGDLYMEQSNRERAFRLWSYDEI